MKPILILSAAVSLLTSSAFAQGTLIEQVEEVDRPIDDLAGTPVYLTTSSSDTPTSVALSESIRKEFENSRRLALVYINPDLVIQVVAPTTITLTSGSKGETIVMDYDISLPRGSKESYKATCRAAKVDDCARTVMLRAEKFARERLQR